MKVLFLSSSHCSGLTVLCLSEFRPPTRTHTCINTQWTQGCALEVLCEKIIGRNNEPALWLRRVGLCQPRQRTPKPEQINTVSCLFMWILIIVKVSLRGGTLALPDANLALLNGAKNNNDTVFNPRGRRQRPSATSWRPSSSTPPRETATCITVSARLPMFEKPVTRLRSDLTFGRRNTCVCTKARTSFGRLLGCDRSRSSAGTWWQESNWPERRMVSSHCPLLIRRKH